MKCPQCGTATDGNFCPSCGASLRPGSCAACQAELVPGARFCTQCGTRAGADAGGRSRLLWYAVGGSLTLAMLIILALPALIDRADAPTPVDPAAPAAGGAPPPLTGTPRQQADQLYNRIMTERESGDTMRARFFTPMAVQAYAMAEPLDDDGLFHLATVHIVAGDFDAARAVAERTLEQNPNHLLALAVAGEAAQKGGDTAAARDYYRRFLAAFDAEIASALPEYRDHANVLPEYRAIARLVMED